MATVPKAILLIGDGLGDRPIASLDGKTPLEAADTPQLDSIAAAGECGLLDPIAPGVRAGSDTAHLALLGYDPHRTYTGRGPFEAAGIGMDVRGGDVCFRCNFATVDDNMTVLDRRAGRISESTQELAAALDGMEIEGAVCLFKESVEHRAALIVRGDGLGHDVTDVDPHEEGARLHQAAGGDAASERTAAVVNEFARRSHEILSKHPVNRKRIAEGLHPANIVLPRGAGVAPHLEPFQERYGITGACIVEVGLIKGLGRYLRMEVIDVPGATGGKDTDEQALARAVVEVIGRHGFVLCNLKAPDLGGHDNDPQQKMEAARKLDRLASYVREEMGDRAFLAVTADHSTPCAVGDHSGDPVPIAIIGPGVRTDSVTTFGERPCAHGGLHRIRGSDLMNILTNLMAVQEKFGA
ncbi:phosphoglycerate mutase [candidate division KD3-62 bacterium DG_56]|uniref:Phosphoglycerate mutase n=1 Tax=candidate division KD3-62 bacterium DG_56 TaxID=1704032 RepID=A0A0S7XN45_9BACT|nr:MAG: phosphoglycerate mutase [candidate division KD3-62 bacterium DG_56]